MPKDIFEDFPYPDQHKKSSGCCYPLGPDCKKHDHKPKKCDCPHNPMCPPGCCPAGFYNCPCYTESSFPVEPPCPPKPKPPYPPKPEPPCHKKHHKDKPHSNYDIQPFEDNEIPFSKPYKEEKITIAYGEEVPFENVKSNDPTLTYSDDSITINNSGLYLLVWHALINNEGASPVFSLEKGDSSTPVVIALFGENSVKANDSDLIFGTTALNITERSVICIRNRCSKPVTLSSFSKKHKDSFTSNITVIKLG